MELEKKQYKTALRDPVLRWIDKIKNVDVLVGIPAYNNEETIGHVISQVAKGLKKYYGDLRTAIFVADGGSVDDTRENIFEGEIPEDIETYVSIYRGLPGKGTSFRAVFECAERLSPKAILVFDSDLRSITPEWVHWMADPIVSGKAEFCSPYYRRHPFDGTITNLIVYPLTVAVFGKDIRQPIGGDFSFNLSLAEYLSSQPVWITDVAKFGIDIWMTLTAVNENFKILQIDLGNKIHNPKDPASDLNLMFFQVLSTLFYIMGDYKGKWLNSYHYSKPDIISYNSPPQGLGNVNVLLEKMKIEFEEGFNHFRPMYKHVLEPETFRELLRVVIYLRERGEFILEADLWAKILYDFFYIFYVWERNRRRLVDIITPLYFGRTGTYCSKVMGKSWEETEEIIQKEVDVFKKNRNYLIRKFEARK
jgi:glycosyltransferase involved in cell wall biosynthesis